MFKSRTLLSDNKKYLIIKGVFWKVFACTCFVISNAFVRYFSGGSPLSLDTPLPIYNIIFFQSLFGIIFLLIFGLFTKKLNNVLTPPKMSLHITRTMFGILGISLWYISLQYMTMIQAVTLSFIGPVLTVIGSKIFLRENFNWQRILSLVLTILGGFIIVRLDKNLAGALDVGVIAMLPIVSAIIFTGDKIITRKIMANNGSSFVLTFYLFLFSFLICSIICGVNGSLKINLDLMPYLVLLGIFGSCAHLSFGKAYKYAQITFLMPFGFSKFIVSGIVGYAVFCEYPNSISMWVGIFVITLSTIILNIKRSEKITNTL